MRTILATLFLLLLEPAFAQAAATPSPNLSDQQFLAQDSTFTARVEQSLLAACSAIHNEANTGDAGTLPLSLHIKRANLCAGIMTPTQLPNWKVVFASMVATDSGVLADATNAGTVPITAGNATAQAALVTDAHIANAISAQFNTLLSIP